MVTAGQATGATLCGWMADRVRPHCSASFYVSVCQRSKTCPLALVSALSSTVVQVVAPGPVLAAAHAVAPVTATVVTATCEPVIFDAKVRRPRMLLRGWALLQ